MDKELHNKLSIRVKTMRRSPIRELLKLVGQPGIISFAGGIPDPTLFPVNLIEDVAQFVLENNSARALQYGPTEGNHSLKEELIKRILKMENVKLNIDEIIITTASQQGLDLTAKIFINVGDIIIVEEPTYLGALQAFRSYGARFIGVPIDSNGMQVDLLEDKLDSLGEDERKRLKLLYTVPDFQNPSGVTLSFERRNKMVELAEKYDILIVEDSPYRELRYWRSNIPTLFSIAPRGRVVTLYTFSKLFCPGMRLGFAIGHREVINQICIAKQGTDLCTPEFNQVILAEVLKRDALDEHIKTLVNAYRAKRECMLTTLNKYMPSHDKVPTLHWTEPDGGLFMWLSLPEYMDTEMLLERAIEKKVAYVIGSAFYHDESENNSMRLNFSYPSFDQIDEGLQRLGEVIEEGLDEYAG